MSAITRLTALATAALVVVTTGCGSDTPNDDPETQPSPTTTPTAAASTRTGQPETDGSVRRITLTIGDRQLTADLNDSAASRDLLARLPVSLSMRDLGSVEKIGHLPEPLSTDGVPAGDDPTIGDLGYYAPWGNLVLYYGDQSYDDGIVRLGRIHGDLDAIATLPDGFTVHIARSHE